MEPKRRRLSGILLVGLVAALGVAAFGFSLLRQPRAEESRPVTAATPTKTVSLSVEGMSCGSCVASVKRSVKALDGVTGIEVSLEERRARVHYEEGKTTPEQIAAAVKELGYKTGEPVAVEAGK